MADQFKPDNNFNSNNRPNLTSQGNFSRQSLSPRSNLTTNNDILSSQKNDINNEGSQQVRTPVRNLSNQVSNPLGTTNSVLDKETVVMVGEDKKKAKSKKKKSKLWLKILIFVVMIILFLSACGLGIFATMQIIAQKDKYKTNTNIVISVNDTIDYTLFERIYGDEDSFDLKKLSQKDMKFKWENGSKKFYELQIVYDRTKTLRFRHYNMLNSVYTKEKLFDVDYISSNINFESKFYLAEDGYYYFDNNSQPGNKITLIFSIDYDIADYRGQFDGMRVDEIFEFEQSGNPEKDWGYYSYLIVK